MLRLLLLLVILCMARCAAVAQKATEASIETWRNLLQKSKPDTNRVLYLLELSNQFMQALPSPLTDSAYQYAVNAEQLSNQLHYLRGIGNSYLTLSKIWVQKQQKEKGKAYVQQAIKIFENAHLYTDLGYALFHLSGFYDLSGTQLTERIQLAEAAVAAFHKDGNIKKEADALKELADVRQIQGNFKQALEEVKRSLQLKQSVNDTTVVGVYDLLCDVSTSLSNLSEAIKYGLLAVATAERQLDSNNMQICTIYNHMGIAYYYQADMETAAGYFKKALMIARNNHSVNDITYISFSYSNILARIDKHAERIVILKELQKNYTSMATNAKINVACGFISSYSMMGKPDSAAPYYQQMLQLTVQRSLPNETQRSVYDASISYLLASKQYQKARPILVAQEKYLTVNATLLQLARNQHHWFQLDSAEGNLASAIAHYKKYKTLNDSIYTQAKSKQIAQLKIQYETDQKDKDILLKQRNIELLTKQSLLQETNLRQTQLVRNITFGGLALLLIIIGLLFSRYRLKQKSSLQINQQNVSLQHLVAEKEWLLKEIHHRVKNNFHMVMGLLGTQSGYLKNEEAVSTMEESRHRIHAMSLIHQKLYQSADFSVINMKDYVHELIDYLRDSFDTRQRILFKMQIESVSLDLTHAIPLGLILNEAVTNSIKYAFPEGADGVISIQLEHITDNQLQLTIHDNGIGLSPGFEFSKSVTMGMNLMQGLTEDIGGVFSIEAKDGTLINITFMYEPVTASTKKLAQTKSIDSV
ncbi:MAG TPA: histidine kinase dimerization/phosphoacceptor domain -containing protein [Chitinophagaceae bacterium]|nr:histidine kinase dimerization/phosphoacceptor domain -containing protein [Chitinophagaceae bacterium]